MKIDLLELLATKEIVHPTIIDSATFNAGQLSLRLRGWTWWLGKSDETSYEFIFENIEEGEFDLSITRGFIQDEPSNEALEDFSVRRLTELDWAQPKRYHIYCSAPLQSPIALYSVLEAHLAHVNSYLSPCRFLNCGDSWRPIGEFAEIASSNSYLLAECPKSIHDILAGELDRQNVKYKVIEYPFRKRETRLWVALNRCDFVCESASAILPD